MVPETYAKSRMSPQDGGREISAVKARASGLGVWMRRIATVIVVVCAPLSLALGPAEAASAHQSTAATGSQWAAQSPMPVISRGVPAYTNDSCAVASSANDSSYDTQWWTCATPSTGAPLYLAYDLSGVPVANRGQVLVLWFNDPQTMQYDYTYVEVHPCCTWKAFGIPSGYTLEANAAPGGTLPTSGWVALATVSGNALHSRQHSLNLSGYNWFRMNVTASVGSTKDYGVILNLDIHDASAGFQDDWIFYGDSITEGAMAHQSLSEFGGTGTWAQLINAARPSNFPAFEAGAIGGTLSADGVKSINGWLALFSGRYVGLAYGTNDAIWAVSPATFYDNYVTLVQAVLAAGKVPIVPKIAWGCTPEILAKLHARRITLHVGLGTFKPVKVDKVEDHRMHPEFYEIPEPPEGKVVAVGTTTCRALETWARSGKSSGWTDLFITPGFEFKVVKSLVTNFHVPKSTLLMLVSAFAGRERVLAAYAEAIQRRYRFYSFGDCMLITP